jgi:Ca-activated chloride channel family protein
MMAMSKVASSSLAARTIGFSVGGAKDVGNFRQNIEKGFLPLPSDVTVEGLFYDYAFNATGQQEAQCNELFCPIYSLGLSRDPLCSEGESEAYLAVGLDSGIHDFHRSKLNLVVVLDVSLSMSGHFDNYYYDNRKMEGETKQLRGPVGGSGGNSSATPSGRSLLQRSKLEIAKDSLIALLGHLSPEERVGIVFYNHQARVVMGLRTVGEIDMKHLFEQIRDIQPGGSTALSAGMDAGSELLRSHIQAVGSDERSDKWENRIIFLTDAQPNTGDASDAGLLSRLSANAKAGVHTTFIGVGVDFNSELVETIGKVRGANYLSVSSPEDFRRRMDDDFDMMVAPLAFDLALSLKPKTAGIQVDAVFGVPSGQNVVTAMTGKAGRIFTVDTLFPSRKEDGGVKGGVILVRLRRPAVNGSQRRPHDDGSEEVALEVRYADRAGKTYQNERKILLQFGGHPRFESIGVRKAMLLQRYASLLQAWLLDAQEAKLPSHPPNVSGDAATPLEAFSRPRAAFGRSIPVPSPGLLSSSGRWERQSKPLAVSAHYARLFGTFSKHFCSELIALGDPALKQESKILEKLATGSSEKLHGCLVPTNANGSSSAAMSIKDAQNSSFRFQ